MENVLPPHWRRLDRRGQRDFGADIVDRMIGRIGNRPPTKSEGAFLQQALNAGDTGSYELMVFFAQAAENGRPFPDELAPHVPAVVLKQQLDSLRRKPVID